VIVRASESYTKRFRFHYDGKHDCSYQLDHAGSTNVTGYRSVLRGSCLIAVYPVLPKTVSNVS